MTKSGDLKLARVVHKAVRLPDPADIARTIIASSTGAHNGLRAATYEAHTRGTGHDVVLTHPERLAEQRIERAKDNREPSEVGHLRELSKASTSFVDAVGALLAECRDAPPPDDWDEALHLANILCEAGYVTAALDVGRNLDRWINDACDAVDAIEAMHQRYSQREATPWERYKRNGGRADEVCEIHAALDPPMFVPKFREKRQLCETCARLYYVTGQAPPVELIRLFERGGQVEYRNARSRWLEDCGVRAESA